MAVNQYVNKVVFGDQTLIDISDSSFDVNSLPLGSVAYNQAGARVEGTAIVYDVYNGLDKTNSGYALDARQGTILDSKINNLTTIISGEPFIINEPHQAATLKVFNYHVLSDTTLTITVSDYDNNSGSLYINFAKPGDSDGGSGFQQLTFHGDESKTVVTTSEYDRVRIYSSNGTTNTVISFETGGIVSRMDTLESTVNESLISIEDDIEEVIDKINILSSRRVVAVTEANITWVSSHLAQIPLTIYRGEKVRILVADNNASDKKVYVALGTITNTNTFKQQVSINKADIVDIVAQEDYNCAYLYFNGTPTRVKIAVWIDGNIDWYPNFSIIGDSYSAFKGYIPDGYPHGYSENGEQYGNDCRSVTDMWWYVYANWAHSAIELCEAYSGSTICNDGYGEGTDDAISKSFVTRVTRLPQSNLIFVFGGTNDSWVPVSVGEYVYSEWTASDLEKFRPAVAYIINWLLHHHAGARIIFIKNTGLTQEISNSIDTICAYYGIDVITLQDTVTKTNNHPNIQGMREIAAQVMYYVIANRR